MSTDEGQDTHEALGGRMHALISELYPICRSITGDGIRETLARIAEEIPLEIHEVPTGTPVLDWTVPKEWNIRDAYIADATGRRVVDFHEHNLHVMSYSVPVDRTMTLEELRPHLYSLPDQPDLIPYRTSYYREAWGFCLEHRRLEALEDGEYHVVIDSTLEPGSLTYGECFIPGQSDDEILLSCHTCHPSLANDNLSGVSVAVETAKRLLSGTNRYSYRLLFIPGTIGSLTWLARNREAAARVKYGLVLTLLGDFGGPSYKRSRRGDALIDRAAAHVLSVGFDAPAVKDFVPYGYDERQYCSPGFDLAVGCLSRSRHGEFPEYHTSADDLSFVRPGALAESLGVVEEILEIIEGDGAYRNLSPYGEPQLGRRGLYGGLAGGKSLPGFDLALLWVLNLSDGEHTLLDIAERANMPFRVILEAAGALAKAELLATVNDKGDA